MFHDLPSHLFSGTKCLQIMLGFEFFSVVEEVRVEEDHHFSHFSTASPAPSPRPRKAVAAPGREWHLEFTKLLFTSAVSEGPCRVS